MNVNCPRMQSPTASAFSSPLAGGLTLDGSQLPAGQYIYSAPSSASSSLAAGSATTSLERSLLALNLGSYAGLPAEYSPVDRASWGDAPPLQAGSDWHHQAAAAYPLTAPALAHHLHHQEGFAPGAALDVVSQRLRRALMNRWGAGGRLRGRMRRAGGVCRPASPALFGRRAEIWLSQWRARLYVCSFSNLSTRRAFARRNGESFASLLSVLTHLRASDLLCRPTGDGPSGASKEPTVKLWLGGIDGTATLETVQTIFSQCVPVWGGARGRARGRRGEEVDIETRRRGRLSQSLACACARANAPSNPCVAGSPKAASSSRRPSLPPSRARPTLPRADTAPWWTRSCSPPATSAAGRTSGALWYSRTWTTPRGRTTLSSAR